MPIEYDGLTPAATRTIACRVSPDLHRQVEEAAEATGRDISTYLRDTLFAETEITLDALKQVRREAAAAARVQAEVERAASAAQLEQARRESARWERRARDLEQDARITGERLLMVVSRVLVGDLGAHAECQRLWTYLDGDDQLRMLPAVAIAVTGQLDQLRPVRPRLRDLRRAMATYSEASWITDSVILNTTKKPVDAAVESAQIVVVMALVQAFAALNIALHFIAAGPTPTIAGEATAAEPPAVEPPQAEDERVNTATDTPTGMGTPRVDGLDAYIG